MTPRSDCNPSWHTDIRSRDPSSGMVCEHCLEEFLTASLRIDTDGSWHCPLCQAVLEDREFCFRCEQEFPVAQFASDEEGNWMCLPCLAIMDARRIERYAIGNDDRGKRICEGGQRGRRFLREKKTVRFSSQPARIACRP